MSQIRVSAFQWVPPLAQGLVRDLRVRWALEEAGVPYEVWLIGLGEEQKSEAYRRFQPFGQVPAYEEDGLVLFESGAIVQHIAERHEVLMPTEPHARERTKCWIFAALNSVEPAFQVLMFVDVFNGNAEWSKQALPAALQWATLRLDDLEAHLKTREYLEDRFTAADLLMASVLEIPRHTDLVAQRPALAAYLRRCLARPAYQKALADQLAVFARNAPPAAGA
ncbi:glutathione S-transferase family protein [Archangium primigenium]|uniref:glutathione S-transferase family protein n=1 Tax=[Archangium] primigenium TaxID=2792470 RepID=UPI0019573D59|nr:glutathione S-transferase family protein [Archangium primigenium]MBM7112817.1 glutathione S-transferase family protein [Archangium primigenium]